MVPCDALLNALATELRCRPPALHAQRKNQGKAMNRTLFPTLLLTIPSLLSSLVLAGCVVDPLDESQDEAPAQEASAAVQLADTSIAIPFSGRCVDINGGSTASGATIIQWDCHGGPNQTFSLVDQGGGYFAIKPKHSGKCLDVADASLANGAPLIQWDCHGGDNQKFRLLSQGGSSYKLQAKHSGKCFDVFAGDSTNGAAITQYDCLPGSNQVFNMSVIDTDAELAQAFAPRLHFDSAASNFPMSAQTFRDQGSSGDNHDYNTIANNSVPTYYQIIRCGQQVRIMYWWFYGHQDTCDGVSGEHNGDWEKVMVTLAEADRRIAAVTYWIHGDHYTRLRERGGVNELEGGPGSSSSAHVVVHVGKTSHASYHEQGGIGTCGKWDDWHNDGDRVMNTWNNLVNLDAASERWMVEDRAGGSSWGPNGISTHPTTDGPSCDMSAASTPTIDMAKGTQCKLGDDDTGIECLRHCNSGQVNIGLFCSDPLGNNWTERKYGYNYTLPTTNRGLLMGDYD
jgi:hypothetical protein